MHAICDLEVTVNGEQTFFVDKKTLLPFSGRLAKLFNKAISANAEQLKSYKAILHELPGGARAFEEVARFCYRRAIIRINATNVCTLRCVGEFLEMTQEIYAGNLVEQTEHFLKGMPFWSWRDVLITLKECEVLTPMADTTGITQRCVDALISRINVSMDHMSPPSSSPESTDFRYSSDTRSSESSTHVTKSSWWFEDLSSLSIHLMERLVKTMISHNMDNFLVSRFLFHYLRSSLPMLGYSSIPPRKKRGGDEEMGHRYSQKVQREVLEIVVNLLCCLERGALSSRSLFGILRVASVLNVSTFCKKQVEIMIGSQLHQATLDNILTPAPPPMGCLYDVDLVLRFVQIFLKNQLLSTPNSSMRSGNHQMPTRSTPSGICVQNGLKRVGCLMDMFITEVAPDVNLKPPKFQALAEALPDDARDSFDGLYRALDIYLEAHPRLCEEEAMRLCKTINYQKLSFEASKQIAQNRRFPSRIAIQVLLLQQSELRSALESHYLKNISAYSPCNNMNFVEGDDESGSNEVILYSKQLDYSSVICEENQELKADLQGMQWRVMELEKVCKKMHSQMSKLAKLKHKNRNISNHGLPKLCS